VLIFVVDDEKAIADTLAVILIDAGFDAKAFLNPRDALKAAQILRPDLLLTDVVMADLNGVELGILFKAIHPACKVLLFSGRTLAADVLGNAGSQGHTFDFLQKPAHPLELISTINLVIA
jgi:DNA-binding NtrC family response regulator